MKTALLQIWKEYNTLPDLIENYTLTYFKCVLHSSRFEMSINLLQILNVFYTLQNLIYICTTESAYIEEFCRSFDKNSFHWFSLFSFLINWNLQHLSTNSFRSTSFLRTIIYYDWFSLYPSLSNRNLQHLSTNSFRSTSFLRTIIYYDWFSLYPSLSNRNLQHLSTNSFRSTSFLRTIIYCWQYGHVHWNR